MSKNAKIITVENRKGGVGKTTTAVILATEIAKRLVNRYGSKAKKVIIIDVDPQGDAATALNLEPNGRCISRVLLGEVPIGETLMSADLSGHDGPHRPNLYLLPSSDALQPALEQLHRDYVEDTKALRDASSRRAQRIKPETVSDVFNEALASLANHEDVAYIILDCPPSLGFLREAVHRFAQYAVVPTKLDYHSVTQTANHTGNIAEDSALGISILAIVPTMVQPRLTLSREMFAWLNEQYGVDEHGRNRNLVSAPVPLLTAVAQGPAFGGLTVFDHAPESPAAAAYEQLIQMVVNAR